MRPLRVSDAQLVVRAVDSSLPELRRFMPWAHFPNTLFGQVARLKRVEYDNLTGHELQFGLFEEGDDELRCVMGLHPRVPLNPRGLEIGYWTVSAHTSRGLCTLGVKIITIYAIELLSCDRVQILTDDANRASQRVAEKAGFALEGRMHRIMERTDEALTRNGFEGTDFTLMWAMSPEALREQPWYDELGARLEMLDILGRRTMGWPFSTR